MDPRLHEAARLGDTSMLHALLRDDPLILDRSSMFTQETSLHVAALAGKLDFVKELIDVKPELANRFNGDGFCAIHMAAANGHAGIVRELLAMDKEKSHLKSGDGRTPLHCAVMTGSVHVLRELINCCPECKTDFTDEDETILHIAVKNGQFKAFEVIVEMLKENLEEMKKMLNHKDLDGNTILHISTSKKQRRIVKILLGYDDRITIDKVDVNLKNNNNLTALDMLENQQIASEPVGKKLYKMLQNAGAVRSQDISSPSNSAPVLQVEANQEEESNSANKCVCLRCLPQMIYTCWSEEVSTIRKCEFLLKLRKEIKDSTPETRSAVMVVAVLIATLTFQAILSPPAGYQQSNGNGDPFDSNGNTDQIPWNSYPLQNSNGNTDQSQHSNGKAVVSADVEIFLPFMIFNAIGFFSSVSVILVLIDQFPLKDLLKLSVLSVSASFVCIAFYIGPTKFNVSYVATMLMVAAVVLQFLRFMWKFAARYTRFRECCGACPRDRNVGV